MKTYVTFGQVHAHSVNGKTFDKDCVAVIHAPTHKEGREVAFELFGDKFFTTYDNKESVHLEYYPRGLIEV